MFATLNRNLLKSIMLADGVFSLAAAVLLSDRLLFYFDTVFFCQVPDGFNIAEALMLHNKGDGVTALATAEILENPLGGDDVERGCFLVREGAQRLVILPGALEGDEIADNVDQINAIFYLINGFSGNHSGRANAA